MMNSEKDRNVVAKNLKDKIMVAAPLTMLMMTLLFERIILQDITTFASIYWFLSVIGFFLISTLLVGYLIYIYIFIKCRCRTCNNKWSRIKTGNICIEAMIYTVSLIQWNILIKLDKIIQSYKCNICNCIEHKKASKYSLVRVSAVK